MIKARDSFATYLGKKDHISASDLKNFLKSPKYYYYKKYQEVRKDEPVGRHFVLGTAIHEVILEPHKFFKHHVVCPKYDRRTAKGKEDYAAFVKQNKRKSIIIEDEMEMLTKIGESAAVNEALVGLMKGSAREVSIYTVDPITDLKIRMRPDVFPKKKSIVDLKTTTDSSYKGFKYDVYNYSYSLTAAFYKDFGQREHYIFAALEKSEPYQISLYELSDEMEKYGREQYRMALNLLKWSYENDFWCDYSEFQILKECYDLNNLNEFLEINKKSSKIMLMS